MRWHSTIGVLAMMLAVFPEARADEKDDSSRVTREIEELRRAANKDRQELQKGLQELKELLASNRSLAEETKNLQKLLSDSHQALVKAQEQANEFRTKLAAASAELQAYKKQMESLPKVIVESDKPVANTTPAPVERIGQPEKEARGKIASVADSGLFVLNVGADNGVPQGIVLDVIRPGPTPPLYLGMMTVVRVYAKQSLGQFKAFGKQRAEVGDEVAPALEQNKRDPE